MPQSLYDTILVAVQLQIENLGLLWNGNPVPVIIRKLPVAEEVLQVLPIIAVTPTQDPAEWIRASFQCQEIVKHKVTVSIIASGNRDFVSNIDTYNFWYESIRTSFKKPPLTGVSRVLVWRTQVKPNKMFDRSLLNRSYDFLSLDLYFDSFQ